MDPFGGIKGKEKKTLSGFSIDKEEALTELALSIKLFERKDQKKKKSFLESLQNKNKQDADIAPNWDYMKDTNLEYINLASLLSLAKSDGLLWSLLNDWLCFLFVIFEE